MDLQEELEFALSTVHRAGEFSLNSYHTRLRVEVKEDGSPVTGVDRAIEQEIRRLINRTYPHDGILGEEGGEAGGTSGRRWIIDPIDGTTAFVRGLPFFGVMLALERAGIVPLGVVHLPALSETVYAVRGQGCWWHRAGQGSLQQARVSSVNTFAASFLLVGGPEYFGQAGELATYGRLLGAGATLRGWSDSYGQVLVATGRAEALVEAVMSPWDAAPFFPILEEAGGCITDWSGKGGIGARKTVSSNRHLHPELLALLTS